MFDFAAPQVLWLLGLLPGLLLLQRARQRQQQQVLQQFGALTPTRQEHRTGLCRLGALATLVVALAQPQWGVDSASSVQQGRDLIFLLDVSLSMLAEDVSPNRLEAAKNSIGELVDNTLRGRGGYRVGLVVFAGRARLQCPLTLDYDVFLQRLANASIDSAPRRGTAIGEALYQTWQGFGELDAEHTDLILLSDGEDHAGLSDNFTALLASLSGQTIPLYTLGVGEPARAAPIPDGSSAGATLHIQEREVLTQMNQALLIKLAHTTGGIYQLADATALDRLFRATLADKPVRDLIGAEADQPAPRYAWLLLPALFLLLLEHYWRQAPGRNPRREHKT